ncbi:hypothetical protein Nepgr_022766 [Nepenthes gracilis]|uniref:Uncharacterized protein n=1 Tax=Nepenthes gracilis TaxID=150966 RepID=A0AAD3XYE6_NEPGR|nr:hypothetical protein Nepgr_022766 [Nepenthes gracilis]
MSRQLVKATPSSGFPLVIDLVPDQKATGVGYTLGLSVGPVGICLGMGFVGSVCPRARSASANPEIGWMPTLAKWVPPNAWLCIKCCVPTLAPFYSNVGGISIGVAPTDIYRGARPFRNSSTMGRLHCYGQSSVGPDRRRVAMPSNRGAGGMAWAWAVPSSIGARVTE